MDSRDRRILTKIAEYCQRIGENLERCHHDYALFQRDHLFQDACCMCIVQIGELAGQLSDEAKRLAPGVPWRIIKDTRNFYVHAYGAIDVPSVWETLNRDIPALLSSCEELLKTM